jgi:hypothetical protein
MLKSVGFPSTRTGDQTIVSGNLVIGTAGKGIDFSADPSAAGMTSQLLDDYEEGTWTPTYAGGVSGVTYGSVQAGHYRKIGSQVTVWFGMMTSGLTVTGSSLVISGLPFTASASAGSQGTVNLSDASRWDSTPPVQGRVEPNSTVIYLISNIGPTGAGVDPVDITTTSLDAGSGNRNRCFGVATYFV